MAEASNPPPSSGPRTPAGPGGFLPNDSLPSPSPSAASTRSLAGLPRPRAHPLRAGSVKEDTVRRYVEDRIMYINRRYVKKFGIPEPGDEVVGYKSMSELCKDLEALINIVWLSGTPNLQIPYLLNIANEFTTWVTAFPPSPAATFSALQKLDHCFASLLSGRDIETNEPLPGFESGPRSGMTRTDMVRCKSLVEQTRVVVVDVMNKEPGEVEELDDDDDADETDATESGADDKFVDPNWDEEDDHLQMGVARVYENTLVQLGEVLGGSGSIPEIPNRTDI